MKEAFHDFPRDAWMLLGARAVSTAQESLLLVGLILRVQATGGREVANAGLMIAMAVPLVVTARWVGDVADRAESRRILLGGITAQVVACLILTTPPTATPGWAFYGACVLFQSGYAFVTPVWMVLAPRIVGDGGVQRLVGAQMLVTSLASPTGAAAAGILVDTSGSNAVPLASAGALAVVAALVLGIRTRRVGALDEDLSGGAGELAPLWADRVLRPVLVGTVVMVLVVQGVNVVEVFLVREGLGASATQYGFTEVSYAMGTAAASVVVGRLVTDRHRVWAITLGFAGCAAVCAAVSGVATFPVYLAMAGALGLANSVANGALGPLFLLRTPESHRGRVMAGLNGLLSGASVLALFAGGLLGTWLGPRATFLAGGLVALAIVTVMGAVTIPAVSRDY